MNFEKLASEIIKESADRQTINKIKMLWDHYKHNVEFFAKQVGKIIKDNRLSFSADKNWLLDLLKKLTGEPWVLQGNDFVTASQMKKIRK